MKEIWKDIENFDNYMISNFGNVKSKARHDSSGKRYLKEKYLKPGKLRHNHLIVILKGNDGLNHTMRVHRIVAMAFLDNPNNYPIINHKDENPSNNHVDNLEWCTYKYNTNYGTAIERRSLSKEKPIEQLTLDDKIIKVWRSAKEIDDKLGLHTVIYLDVVNITENKLMALNGGMHNTSIFYFPISITRVSVTLISGLLLTT